MKKAENGRSMVEMLGVLAIIGILSVTGIYGYTIAMRRYRANEIAQTASMLAVIAHAADQGSGECMKLSKTSLSQNPGGIALDMEADGTRDPVQVDIQMVNEDISLCDAVQDISPQIVHLCGTSALTKCPE